MMTAVRGAPGWTVSSGSEAASAGVWSSARRGWRSSSRGGTVPVLRNACAVASAAPAASARAALAGGHVEIAPINSRVVTAALEDRLVLGSQLEGLDRSRCLARPDDFLVRRVHGEVGRRAEIDGDLVRLLVAAFDPPDQVGDRAGQHVEIVGHRKAQERELDPHGVGFEAVDRAAWAELRLMSGAWRQPPSALAP